MAFQAILLFSWYVQYKATENLEFLIQMEWHISLGLQELDEERQARAETDMRCQQLQMHLEDLRNRLKRKDYKNENFDSLRRWKFYKIKIHVLFFKLVQLGYSTSSGWVPFNGILWFFCLNVNVLIVLDICGTVILYRDKDYSRDWLSPSQ